MSYSRCSAVIAGNFEEDLLGLLGRNMAERRMTMMMTWMLPMVLFTMFAVLRVLRQCAKVLHRRIFLSIRHGDERPTMSDQAVQVSISRNDIGRGVTACGLVSLPCLKSHEGRSVCSCICDQSLLSTVRVGNRVLKTGSRARCACNSSSRQCERCLVVA